MLRGTGNKDNIREEDAYENIFILIYGAREQANLFSGETREQVFQWNVSLFSVHTCTFKVREAKNFDFTLSSSLLSHFFHFRTG